MTGLLWAVLAYLAVGVLVFVGLWRKLEPLDWAAVFILAWAALVWPLTLARGQL